MNGVTIQDPNTVANDLNSASKMQDPKKRSKAVTKIDNMTYKLFQKIAKIHGSKFTSANFEITKNYMTNLLLVVVEGQKEPTENAIQDFLFAYSKLYELKDAEGDEADQKIKTLLAYVVEEENGIVICSGEPSNDDEDVSSTRHISIKKPGDILELETVTISPDFAKFLRLKHTPETPYIQLVSLGSFEKWLYTRQGQEWLVDNNIELEVVNETEEGPEYDKAAIAKIYRTQLTKAFEEYERDAYCKEYCRPQNISMPGIQYGHRLLRLPIQLKHNDKESDFATGEIYEGPTGRLQVPDVDFEELVRRYINALYLKEITIYNIDDITEDYINNYFAEQTLILDPDKFALFREATKTAINSDILKNFIRDCIEQGRDLTPAQLSEWMLTDDANDFESEIVEILATGVDRVHPSINADFLAQILDSARFEMLFLGLCTPVSGREFRGANYKLPAFIGGAYREGDWELDGMGPILWRDYEDPEELLSAVIDRIDALSEKYDKVWRVVKEMLGDEVLWSERNDIQFSGYEFYCILNWLTCAALWYQTYNQGLRYQETSTKLKYKIEELNLVISENDVVNMLGIDMLRQSDFRWDDLRQYIYSEHEETVTEIDAQGNETEKTMNVVKFSEEFKKLRDDVVTSYKTLIDRIISFATKAVATSASTEEPESDQLLKLYMSWIGIFETFIRQYTAQRRIGKESLITLRLAPRAGKYEEIPKPGTDQVDTSKVLSSHPTMQTEKYMLEPMPLRYVCNNYPTLYLREDLSLRVRHRGFGIGANLYSMSLLPEEKQIITVKSFKDTSIKKSESTAENIFEETTDETSEDFAREIQNESERESSSQSEFSVSGKASASCGWGSASIESGYSSQSSARSLAKNTSNVSNRLASKLSAKRTVSVETKRTVDRTVEEHSEIATEREVKNPNKGHTVTFHWFQMTRKLATELRLDDLKLTYTSGVHHKVAVFGNGKKPIDEDCTELFRYLPDDIGRKLPPDTIIVVCAPPYNESIAFSNANAFLSRIFTKEKAQETSTRLWQLIGWGDPAPEGYGITAYCEPRRLEPADDWEMYINVTNPEVVTNNEGSINSNKNLVPADEIKITTKTNDEENEDTLYLPNIDLRYKVEDGLAPSRYSADEFDNFSLPRTLLREEQVINTNGVYCDAMVGQCSALEDYLQRHRDLDLLEKKIEVGEKELEFKWALAKDGMMVDVVEDNKQTIVGIVKENIEGQGFKDRIDLEQKKINEDIEIATEMLKKQKLEAELAELTKKIEQMKIADYKLDLPEGTSVEVNVDLPDKENE